MPWSPISACRDGVRWDGATLGTAGHPVPGWSHVRASLNQDKISVPLLVPHRDRGLCPCESGQHISMSLPTHPTCMNVSSFSLTWGLAGAGQSLLGETEAQSQPGSPAHQEPCRAWSLSLARHGISLWNLAFGAVPRADRVQLHPEHPDGSRGSILCHRGRSWFPWQLAQLLQTFRYPSKKSPSQHVS